MRILSLDKSDYKPRVLGGYSDSKQKLFSNKNGNISIHGAVTCVMSTRFMVIPII